MQPRKIQTIKLSPCLRWLCALRNNGFNSPPATGSSFWRKSSAAVPADFEGGGVLFAAVLAEEGRPGDVGAKVGVDDLARASGVVGVLDPDLRQGQVDGQLARDARGVRVEDLNANAPVREKIREEVRLRQVPRGVDPFQKRYDSMALTPSSLIPERPDTLV